MHEHHRKSGCIWEDYHMEGSCDPPDLNALKCPVQPEELILPLGLQQLEQVFKLWIIGIIVSTIVFIFEKMSAFKNRIMVFQTLSRPNS